MLQTPTSSPRRPCVSEGLRPATREDVERTRSQSGSINSENFIGRSLTARDQYYTPRAKFPHQRPFLKNMAELPVYFPPQMQEHGKWEWDLHTAIPPSTAYIGPRFGGPRNRVFDKDSIDFSSLPILKQSPKNRLETFDSANSADNVSEEKYRAQLTTFSRLPVMAHERIREFGNEIVSCYTMQFCKFYNDALVETVQHAFAVFTKKARTGQRWMMIFRHDRGRVTVSYNKLLTTQLQARPLNAVTVEVEPPRHPYNASPETCIFNFDIDTDASKFLRDFHESQSIAWNHREVYIEKALRATPEGYMENPAFGFHSPRPLSARSSTGYMVPPPEIPQPLTPRIKVLPPVQLQPSRNKRSPFTMSSRTATPRAELDENWRNCENTKTPKPVSGNEGNSVSSSTSINQSPIKKRSKGSHREDFGPLVGGDGDFLYNSLTHSMALQPNLALLKQKTAVSSAENTSNISKDVPNGRRFHASEIRVSSKRDVGTGAPDEEFSSLGAGEIHLIDNGDDQFDEIRCYSPEGDLLFTQILFGWNKVRVTDAIKNPSMIWWIGAVTLEDGAKLEQDGSNKIREFKVTFVDDEIANKFSKLFQEGTVKGNNSDIRSKYLAQSLRRVSSS